MFAQRPAPSANPRIATWNIQYFPDTEEQQPASEDDATDVQWLACAIASLDVDVLAVQEFKTTDRAQLKQQELIARLNELTGGDWRIQVDACPPPEVQHPGFMYDASRVTATQFREIPILNPDPVCSNEVSPGFGAYFQIEGGPDFHFISVHMQAGDGQAALDKRAYSLSQMEQVVNDAYAIVPDLDIFFAGDFNTSGCEDCSPPMSSDTEVVALSDTMSSMSVPLALVLASQTCSRQDDARSHLLLDHFVVAQSVSEVPAGSVAQVTGICEAIGCDRLQNGYEDARNRLSDHCPVILALAAEDDD